MIGKRSVRDIHLRRARQLLSPTFDEASYRAIGSTEKEIAFRGRAARASDIAVAVMDLIAQS